MAELSPKHYHFPLSVELLSKLERLALDVSTITEKEPFHEVYYDDAEFSNACGQPSCWIIERRFRNARTLVKKISLPEEEETNQGGIRWRETEIKWSDLPRNLRPFAHILVTRFRFSVPTLWVDTCRFVHVRERPPTYYSYLTVTDEREAEQFLSLSKVCLGRLFSYIVNSDDHPLRTALLEKNSNIGWISEVSNNSPTDSTAYAGRFSFQEQDFYWGEDSDDEDDYVPPPESIVKEIKNLSEYEVLKLLGLTT